MVLTQPLDRKINVFQLQLPIGPILRHFLTVLDGGT